MQAEILYKDRKGCEKNDSFSLKVKARLEIMRITPKIALKKISHLIWTKKSVCSFTGRKIIHYEIAPAILKIGRYIEITSPPTTTPKKTSIKGSIISVKFFTA